MVRAGYLIAIALAVVNFDMMKAIGVKNGEVDGGGFGVGAGVTRTVTELDAEAKSSQRSGLKEDSVPLLFELGKEGEERRKRKMETHFNDMEWIVEVILDAAVLADKLPSKAVLATDCGSWEQYWNVLVIRIASRS